MILGLYRGFSSYQYQKAKTFALSDVQLVEMDLLNNIFTRRGERVNMPTFGTQIPDLTFEPLDEITLDIVQSELEAVFNFDPRVQLLQLNVVPDYNTGSIIASAKLFYIELNMTDTLTLNLTFESQQ